MSKPSGHWEPQIGNFKAFIPNPLPPENLQIGGTLALLLSKADRALGRLDGSIATLPDADQFVSMFVRREAVLSSQIEGTHASIMDVLEFEAEMQQKAETVDIQEVVNCIDATNRGLELLETLPLSTRLIKDVHAVLMNGVRGGEPTKTPGEFRKSQNWIGGASPATARFVPPPWEEAVRAFAELEKFINAQDQVLPPLIAAGLIHAQFETIHPFLDGNGRTGRLLITFWLIANNVVRKPVVYPSLYLKREQEEYVRRLDATRSESAWESWLEFFLDAMAQAADEATTSALAVIELRKRHQDQIRATFKAKTPTALSLLDQLYRNPVVNVKYVMKHLGVSQPTASAMLNDFETAGLVKETSGRQRDRVFAYSEYLALFPGVSSRS